MKATRFFLAAGIMFVTALTLSCSGDDGADGKDGAGCEVHDIGTGFKMTCSNGEVGWAKAYCGTEAYNPESQICDIRNNNVYKYKTIGTQTWLTDDLKETYDWVAAAEACPVGWKLPSKDDWDKLIADNNSFIDNTNSEDEWWTATEFTNPNRAYSILKEDLSLLNEAKTKLNFVRCIKK